MRKWITGRQIGDFVVERHELPRSGGQAYISLATLNTLVIHTTEGATVSGGLDTLAEDFTGPNWVVGEDRIIQTRPIGAQGASLRDNGGSSFHPNSVGQQVECIGKSKEDLHRLKGPTWRPLVALVAFLHEKHGVPLLRPNAWKDDCSDITTILATNNTRRLSRKAVGFHGLLGHIDIPDQGDTWHWDPGALDYTALIDEAGGGMQLSDKVTISQDPPEELTVEQVLRQLLRAARAERDRDVAERARQLDRQRELLREVDELKAATPDPAAFAEKVARLLHNRLNPDPEPPRPRRGEDTEVVTTPP